MKQNKWLVILLAFVLLKFIFHLFINTSWSFHRDELLFLALGRHLDLGYASVPPGIGIWSWIAQNVLGGTLFSIRLISSLFGSATIFITVLIAKELINRSSATHTDGSYAMILIGISGLVSGAFLRTSMMFQPVVFDIFYWTLLLFLLLKYINTKDGKWILFFGVVTGIALLNKYTIFILLAALLPAILFTNLRKLFTDKNWYWAILIGLLIFLPNLYWQIDHKMPVIRHMTELAETQFAHVEITGFFVEQLMFFLPVFFIWIPGLAYIGLHKEMKEMRLFAWMYFIVLGILLLFSAKSYYSLGCYPFFIAAGAVLVEQKIYSKSGLLTYCIPIIILLIGIPAIPVSLPVFPPDKLTKYIANVKEIAGLNDITRWENGRTDYALPQDYADMLGWKELGEQVGLIWQSIPDRSTATIYGDSYGHAGAVQYFGKKYGIREVMSFSDAFAYWLPDSLDRARFQTFIYVNDDLGDDMPGFFKSIEKKFELNMPLSRSHGDEIYLCTGPTDAFFERINLAIKNAKSDLQIADGE